MAVTFAGNYASPLLRKAVFDRLHPGADICYEVVRIGDVFPMGHDDTGESGALEAVICTIICPDGWYVTGVKEIELKERGKDGKWRDVPQTPEQLQGDQTKAMGRALRDAGIPQKADELMALMRWIVDLDGKQPSGRTVNRQTGEIRGSFTPEDVDGPDAGSSDQPSLEQQVAMAFSNLSGPDKALVAQRAKAELALTNIMRSGDQAGAVSAIIEQVQSNAEPEFA